MSSQYICTMAISSSVSCSFAGSRSRSSTIRPQCVSKSRCEGAERKTRHVVVTGGSSGIGKATATGLAEDGHRVTIACRNDRRGADAADDIKRQTGNAHVRHAICDLSSLDSVRAFASKYIESGEPLHVLVNNAGVMACPKSATQDGFELQLGVGDSPHTRRIAPRGPSLTAYAPFSGQTLLQSCRGHLRRRSRRKHLLPRSELHGQSKSLLLSPPAARQPVTAATQSVLLPACLPGYFRWNAYAQSKLANSLFCVELARRAREQRAAVSCNCFHPGIVDTQLIRHVLPASILQRRERSREASEAFAKLIGLKSSREGASTAIFLATSAHVEGITGGYFIDSRLAEPSKRERDEGVARKLWKETERLVGHAFQVDTGETIGK